METRRLRKRVRGMPAERSPEWLPEGWTVEARNTRHGKYMYYRSQASGCTFQSKEELLRYLKAVKLAGGTSGRASVSNESKKQSPDSAKKWNSQSTGKKHHLIEEILDSNGELSETVTVADKSPQPPSSPENVKVKPEEEDASESATLSTRPCSRNPMERTLKNCIRDSNISNEKAGMESEENLNPENITENPSPSSDKTLMAAQSDDGRKLEEDETKKGRELKPESAATISIDNCMEEDEISPLRVSNEPSDHLLGDELKLVMANQTTSAEKGNLLDPQKKKKLSEVEKELPVPVVVGNPSTPDLVKPKHGSRKTKAMNAVASTPQQPSSRQFTCVETDQATDVDMGGERPHELKTKHGTFEELPRSRNEEGGSGDAAESFEGGSTTIDWPDFSSGSPFGESWSDPCLEFAFKTLTGDLPVLDDAIAIQEYFQHNLFLVEGSNSPDVLLPTESNNERDGAPASEEVRMKVSNEQDLQGRSQSSVMEKK